MTASFDYRNLPKEPVPCPICASTQFTTLCDTDRYLMGLSTSRCDGCGLIMTNPLPTTETLNEFYHHHYRKYYRKLEHPDLSYIRRYSLDARAAHTVRFLQSAGLLPQNARVLDVGCGEGSILRQIHVTRPDIHAVGVEMYKPFADFARTYAQVPIYPVLDELPEGEAGPTYDLVILSHVLEHVPDPPKFMAELATYLKPTGRLFIDVPDVTKYHWLADLHIAHIYHFSRATLARTAEKAGLHTTQIEIHKPPKLPSCIRAVFAGAPVGERVTVEPDPAEDAATAEHIRAMKKNAWLFNKCFSFSMWFYETMWAVKSKLPGASK